MSENLTPVPHPLDRLLHEAIRPNAEKIEPICLERDVAIVFFEMGVSRQARKAAKQLGWKGGKVEVQRMSQPEAMRLASRLPAADPAAAWLRRHTEGRIFVLMHGGTLCVNYCHRKGWFSIEPGTLDGEWMN